MSLPLNRSFVAGDDDGDGGGGVERYVPVFPLELLYYFSGLRSLILLTIIAPFFSFSFV